LRQTLQEGHLKKIPDLNRLAKRFQKKIGNLQDVVRLYQVVVRLPELVESLAQYKDSHEKLVRATFTAPLQQCAEDLDKFREMVVTTIDLEAVSNHQFLIKADFDEDLQSN
jgi:DNA mismatch repair protein MSH2